jgi:hypothetical protein
LGGVAQICENVISTVLPGETGARLAAAAGDGDAAGEGEAAAGDALAAGEDAATGEAAAAAAGDGAAAGDPPTATGGGAVVAAGAAGFGAVVGVAGALCPHAASSAAADVTSAPARNRRRLNPERAPTTR